MSSCEIPRDAAPETTSTPNSIHVPLFADEDAGNDFSTWPQAVQNIHIRELDRWAKRNPTLDIVEQKHLFVGGVRICVTEFQVTAKVPA